MPYVQRNQSGDVIAFYPREQKGVAEELLADDHADLRLFRLASMKAAAQAAVSEDAESIRMRFITPGAGKALAYQEKAAQARAFLADVSPTQAKYPLIYAEVGITAENATAVATVIDGKYQQFRAIEAAIARVELGARKAIRDAAREEDVRAVLAGIAWPQA